MYTLSNWIAAIVCRLRNKPLFFWGHGLYGNENFIKKFVRITYYRLADFHFVYNNRSRDLMTISGISAHKIHVVYNSLDYSRHDEIYRKKDPESIKTIKERLFPTKGNLPMITFIGRLTREKKVHYLIEAIDLCQKKGHVYNCLIVGEGAEFNNLRNLVSRLRLNEQFVFYGSSYKEETNAGFIMASDCTVSPGNIGLTAIHSLALGTPVITHDNLNTQGPESEAVIQNKTGLLFIENDVMSLSDTIDDMILNERKRFMESSCTEEIKNKWNPSNQTGIIVKAILSQKNL
jgi:glycosyltransferase involved in cell wall biosynthesis